MVIKKVDKKFTRLSCRLGFDDGTTIPHMMVDNNVVDAVAVEFDDNNDPIRWILANGESIDSDGRKVKSKRTKKATKPRVKTVTDNDKLTCKRCGQCCQYITLPLVIPDEFDSHDYIDWLRRFPQVKFYRGGDGHTYLKIHGVTCQYLTFSHDGKASCLINDNKPEICKEFTCW